MRCHADKAKLPGSHESGRAASVTGSDLFNLLAEELDVTWVPSIGLSQLLEGHRVESCPKTLIRLGAVAVDRLVRLCGSSYQVPQLMLPKRFGHGTGEGQVADVPVKDDAIATAAGREPSFGDVGGDVSNERGKFSRLHAGRLRVARVCGFYGGLL